MQIQSKWKKNHFQWHWMASVVNGEWYKVFHKNKKEGLKICIYFYRHFLKTIVEGCQAEPSPIWTVLYIIWHFGLQNFVKRYGRF